MTDEYDPRWHAERALELLAVLAADWDDYPPAFRRAAVRTAYGRLERALDAGEPAAREPSARADEESEGVAD